MNRLTTTHYWNWPSQYTSEGQSYPPLGYWGQYLVGIAAILPEVNGLRRRRAVRAVEHAVDPGDQLGRRKGLLDQRNPL